MEAEAAFYAETREADRLRKLAARCRDLSELTAVPDIFRELTNIAEALDREAERAVRN